MSKKGATIAFFLILGALPAMAHGAPRGEAKATFAGKSVSIDYGRPSLQGRDMLAKAEVGQPWRMGADTPTTLTTEADLAFGAASVPKGSYVLKATRMAEDKWVLNILDKEGRSITDVPLAVGKLTDNVETFTIGIHAEKDRGEIALEWGKTSLKAAFVAK